MFTMQYTTWWGWIGWITLAMLLSSCANITNLEFTIPDNYEGFLVIEYECENGTSADQSSSKVHITFDNTGVACLTDTYSTMFPGGAFHVSAIHTRSGKGVRFQGPISDTTTGYALTSISTMRRRTNFSKDAPPDFILSILWVGEMQNLNAILKGGNYSNELATFLEQELGIPRRMSEPRRQP
jgi:hypothetical protein